MFEKLIEVPPIAAQGFRWSVQATSVGIMLSNQQVGKLTSSVPVRLSNHVIKWIISIAMIVIVAPRSNSVNFNSSQR